MSNDLNHCCTEGVSKKLSKTKFERELQQQLSEGRYGSIKPKFSKGVKTSLLLQTEKSIQSLVDSIANKEEQEQLQILQKGISVQEVPEYAILTLAIKNTVSKIQKDVNAKYITSNVAKEYLEKIASKLTSLLAHQCGQQSAKTVSYKDAALSSQIWLPLEYNKAANKYAKKNAWKPSNKAKQPRILPLWVDASEQG
jgi:hypothetical protein